MHGFSLEGFDSLSFDPSARADDYSYLAKKVKIEQLTYLPGEEDPKEVVMNRLGNVLDDLLEIYGSRVLVATAPTPIKKSSILQTQSKRDKDIEESRWQGKLGLILKLGVSAFECDPRYPSYEWKGPKPAVGDWCYYRTSDAWEAGLLVSENTGISVRYIWDSDIVGSVASINTVW